MAPRIVYKLKKMVGANYGSFYREAEKIASKCGKPALLVLADALYCSVRYGAGLSDYTGFRFYELKAGERKKYVTVSVNNKFVRHMNDGAYRSIFDRKTEFAKVFREYMGRDIFLVDEGTPEEFAAFLKNKEFLYAKPDSMCSGIGVERVRIGDFDGAGPLYQYLKERRCAVAEEAIVQHEDLARLNPSCVNTIRVITIASENGCEIVGAVLKSGNGGIVDNMGAGGLCAPVDLETGAVTGDASIRRDDIQEKHPITGVVFRGLQIPMWDEVKALVAKVSAVVPQVRFVGWDIAVTPRGPVIVEGNYYPGNGLWQIPDKRGKMDIVKRYMKR